jgi:hypothetical protein
MKVSHMCRLVALATTVIFALAGCGGTGTAVPQGAMTQTVTRNATESATSNPLIYVSNGCGGICILSYPGGQVVSTITLSPVTGGDCSDSSGNVYVANDTDVVEYARGDSTPIATYSLDGDQAAACSVDPVSGNLAVVFSGSGANVAVFPPGSRTPTYYETHIVTYYCGYDASGNLFVDGLNGHAAGLAELGNGALDFTVLTINGDIGTPGQVQWDGSYIAVQSRTPAKISRLAISGSAATIVGTTRLKGKVANASQSWIYGGRIIVPYAIRELRIDKIGVWKYPEGGQQVSKFAHFGGSKFKPLGGVTISATSSLPAR